MTTLWFGMLSYSAPLLIVYVIAVIVALAKWGCWPKVCMLVMVASVLMLMTTFGQTLVQAWIFPSGRTAMSAQQFANWNLIIGIVSSALRAAAFGLLVWAAFVDRPVPVQAAFETLPPPVR